MKMNNFEQFELLDEASSNEVQRLLEGLIVKNGMSVEYVVFDSDTNTFLDSVSMGCAMWDNDDEDGEAVVNNYFELLFASKSFVDKAISPSDKDEIIFNGNRYAISSLTYYDRNNVATNISEKSFLITMQVAQKGSYTRK